MWTSSTSAMKMWGRQYTDTPEFFGCQGLTSTSDRVILN